MQIGESQSKVKKITENGLTSKKQSAIIKEPKDKRQKFNKGVERMTPELLKALKREMKKRKALHCVYGFSTASGQKVVANAKKARYFTSEKAFEKWADLVSLTGCVILALHPHHIGK